MKQDALLKEQLPAWFAAVGQQQNPVVAAYLQALLTEVPVLAKCWGYAGRDVNTKWRGLTIQNKDIAKAGADECARHSPDALCVTCCKALPRRNEWFLKRQHLKMAASSCQK